jgi:ABC-type bacteriocin/lantibiotic exporter with double-glycine peptidase domain
LLNQPIAALASGICQMQEAAGALMRLNDLTAHPFAPTYNSSDKQAPPEQVTGRLTIQNVTFGHTPRHATVSGIDLDIEPGRMVALLGSSGSGKSTLARLAAGLTTPWSGQILLDGRPLSEWPSEELCKHVIYVTQAASVFTGTVAENISMWSEDIDAPRIVEAARAAGLHDSLERHRRGYASKLTQTKGGLSGGEMQRMTLARAMAHKPKLFVLDETTSALDPQAEEAVLSGLRETGASVLIVTHREGTALRCDEAVVLEKGRIQCRGRPADLLHIISDRKIERPAPFAIPTSAIPFAPATKVASA